MLLTIAMTLIPTLIYVAIIYWADQYEKEPVWLLAAVFIWGAIPAILLSLFFSLVIQATLSNGVTGEIDLTLSTLSSPLIEETAKALGLAALFIIYRDHIDSPLDGIIYGAMVGVGFSMVENFIFYSHALVSDGRDAMIATVILRGIVFGALHPLYSGIVGLGFAIRKLNRYPLIGTLALIIAWGTAITLHFLHNATINLGNGFVLFAFIIDCGALLAMLVIILLILFQERRWIRKHLRDEHDLLRPHQYHVARSRNRRNIYLLSVLLKHGFGRFQRTRRFYSAVSRLAYRKQYLSKHPEYTAEIEALRAEIRRLNALKIGD